MAATLLERLTELVDDEEKRRKLPELESGDMTVAEAHAALLPYRKRFHIDFSLQSSEAYGTSLEWSVWTWEDNTPKRHGKGTSLRSGVEAAVAYLAAEETIRSAVPANDPLIAADLALEGMPIAQPAPA